MKKLLTFKDLAELFQKHDNTIYRWFKVDRLFPDAFRVKDGGYVPEPDFRRLTRNGRVHAADQRT
ncbi:MAG: hypothetical protein E6K65_16000 [Nitrospirae bacterium]|nr:MAG: hypothetical protein E6K65_16000 [Nitrospirota bacterium]